MDGKREKKQKADSLDKFLKLVIVPIEKLRRKEIDEFRKDWEIPEDGFKKEKELKNWDETIQKKIPEKKYNVTYFEYEIIYEVEDGKITNIIPIDFLEKYPRILELGNKNIFRNNEIYGNAGAGVRLGGDEDNDGISNDVYDNIIKTNSSGGIKFQRSPQGKICGNKMEGNSGGNSVGSFGEKFKPTSSC